MKISSDQLAKTKAQDLLGHDLSTVSHNLMGSISALLMCEHLLSKELAPTAELADNPTLQVTLSLLKETANQIRDHGDLMMQLSHRYNQQNRSGFLESEI
jgi:hypothetical protein